MVFIHGWPDTFRLWDGITDQFENDHIVLNISYLVDDRFGISFPEIIQRLKRTIDNVDGGRNLTKVFVTHGTKIISGYFFYSILICFFFVGEGEKKKIKIY